MAVSKVNIQNFLGIPADIPILDVRSPSEFKKAHIPGAISLPLFTDEERKEIGTAYKQVSRETAIRIGLKAFGSRLLDLVDETVKHAGGQRRVRLHCWRGGMRSSAVAWLLELYGFKVFLLTGGYKAYRHHVLQVLDGSYHLLVLGGYTGSNKTGALTSIGKAGQPVIDLEALAGHKGSAFGNLLQIPQPSQEHFENLLAEELKTQSAAGQSQPLWVEAESQRVGQINIPLNFFNRMRESQMVFLDIPFEKRLQHIIADYGNFDKEKLINAIIRIKKKLGGLETKNAVNALLEDDVAGSFAILLRYYDKLYLKSTKNTGDTIRLIENIASETTDALQNMKKILAHVTDRQKN